MTTDTRPRNTPEAEQLADAILKAAGSGLRHYSMAKTRETIFTASQAGIDESRQELLEALEILTMMWEDNVIGSAPKQVRTAIANAKVDPTLAA